MTNPTPILIRPRTRTILLLALLVAAVLLFRAAPSLVPILLGGATLALILSFPVRLLSQVMSRRLAILAVVLALLLLALWVLLVVLPSLISDLSTLIMATPQLTSDAEGWLRELLRPLAERGFLPAEPDVMIDNLRGELLDRAQALATAVLSRIGAYLTGAFGTLLQAFGILFVAVYLLLDIRRFESVYLSAVPSRYRGDALWLWEQLGHSLSRYLAGLLVSLAIQGVLAAVILWMIGVPYSLLLGLWTSVTAILPYIGAWIGAIPVVILALFISPLTAVLAALAYLVINQLEGNVLTPRIQGESIRVHPLLVFAAVIAGGEIAGLLARPSPCRALAVLRVLAEFFADRLQVREPVEPSLESPRRLRRHHPPRSQHEAQPKRAGVRA